MLPGGAYLDVDRVEYMHDFMSDARRTHKDQKFFYVDSSISGSTSYSGRRWESALPTIGSAYSLTTAARGDTIFTAPFHSETRTAVLTVANSYVQIEGKKLGNQRATFTINGAVDLFSLEAAGCSLKSLELTIVTTDAATALVNLAGSDCVCEDLYIIPSATSVNVVDVFTLASGANDCVIENCQGYNTTVAINSWVSIEAAVARCRFENNLFRGDVATAGIIDSAAATQLGIFGNKIVTIGTNIPACILDSNPTGQAIGNHMYGTDSTIANNAQWGTALILGDNFTRGGTGSTVSASDVIPSLDT